MAGIKDDFSNNLKYFLKLRNKTQAELAKFLNVSKATITNYITGVNLPRMAKVDDICKFLDIEKNDLLKSKRGHINKNFEGTLIIAKDIQNLSQEQQKIILTMIKQFKNNNKIGKILNELKGVELC